MLLTDTREVKNNKPTPVQPMLQPSGAWSTEMHREGSASFYHMWETCYALMTIETLFANGRNLYAVKHDNGASIHSAVAFHVENVRTNGAHMRAEKKRLGYGDHVQDTDNFRNGSKMAPLALYARRFPNLALTDYLKGIKAESSGFGGKLGTLAQFAW
jgi:hypothetical protein